ncbi:pyridoxal-phosphate dependent enzyme [Fulvivirga sp. 29W222]|uniref:Pyridoxal-phosphate dependent enzyme n=1 Tax=Fulvivirga marina TaxID=2494733 RepID=A0A937FZZ3_9BACT|nr:pyridoxal-phosphate dependent enzyme [Fulvivirga marina]MBL6447578.1 pyridoxal-phosphate dependent enzyme [Fulvivirga marina]
MIDAEVKSLLIEKFEQNRSKDVRSIFDYPLLPEIIKNNSYLLEAGNTPLWKLESLSDFFKLEIFLKCESNNPSGSFKDRETVLPLSIAWEKGEDHLYIYSSGNAACSAAYYGKINHKKITAIVPGDIYPEKLSYIIELGANVIMLGDELTVYEEGYETYQKALQILHPNNSYKDLSVNNIYRNEGGKTISVELVDQLNGVPDFIIAPTANGSLISGVWKGLTELYEIGYIHTLPQIVSVGVENASPIYDEINDLKKPKRTGKDKNYVVGSTLAASKSYDMHFAIRAIKESNGHALSCSWEEIVQAYKKFEHLESDLIKKENIILEPSAMTPFVALDQLRMDGRLKPNMKVVLLGTGDGHKSLSLLQPLLGELPVTNKLIGQDSNQIPSNKKDRNLIKINNDLESLLIELQKLS